MSLPLPRSSLRQLRLGRKVEIVPPKGEQSKLVTSALPYVNNTPHLGNIVGCVLSADAWTRYERLRGHNTLYICGTDEYGTATEHKAYELKKTPKEVCDTFFPEHKNSYEWLNIDFDNFSRTTCKYHVGITQEIYTQLAQNGFIHKSSKATTYCESCDKFLADRFVRGICPKCKYDDAAGDQCDKCCENLDPTELIEPKCNYCKGKKVIQKESPHADVALPKLAKEVEALMPESDEAAVGRWSGNARKITEAWLKGGLQNRSISRDLEWGVPVPDMEKKVFYVWFDAPIGYISATEEFLRQVAPDDLSVDWRRWWKRPKDEVELVQFMGKDNTTFHTIIFPAVCMGTRAGFTTVQRISVTEYLNYEGKKFSKSRGIGVFGPQLKSSGIPADCWRFYLLMHRPETSDSNFDWMEFQKDINSILNEKYGNLISRLHTLYKDCCIDLSEKLGLPVVEITSKLLDDTIDLQNYVDEYCKTMEKLEIQRGLEDALRCVHEINAYLTKNEPWKLTKKAREQIDAAEKKKTESADEAAVLLKSAEDPVAAASKIISIAVAGALSATILLHPYIPESTLRCLDSFGVFSSKTVSLKEHDIRFDNAWKLFGQINRDQLRQEIKDEAKLPPLFSRIKVDELQQQFRPPPRKFTLEASADIKWPFILMHFTDLNISRAAPKTKKFLDDILAGKGELKVPEDVRQKRFKAYAEGRIKDGVDDGQFKTSVENLDSQVKEKKKLPGVNTAVDIYNALSLHTVTICGLYDCENIKGTTLRYRKATGNEEFYAIGKGKPKTAVHQDPAPASGEARPPTPEQKEVRTDYKVGDWALMDESNNILTLCLTKQSSRVAVTKTTTEAIMCCQGSNIHSAEEVKAFADAVSKAIIENCGGKVTQILPSAEKKE